MALYTLVEYWDLGEDRLSSIMLDTNSLTSLYDSDNGGKFIRQMGGRDVQTYFIPQISDEQMERYTRKEKMFFIEGLTGHLLQKGESFDLFFAHGDSVTKLNFGNLGFCHDWTKMLKERKDVEKVWFQDRRLMVKCFGDDYNLSRDRGTLLGSWKT